MPAIDEVVPQEPPPPEDGGGPDVHNDEVTDYEGEPSPGVAYEPEKE